jgi:hypothetical protein
MDMTAKWAGLRRKETAMRGKIVFVAGVGVGYVLGARAGRERFDWMVAQARKAWESPTVQEAAGVMQAQANKLYGQGKEAMSTRVHRLSNRNGSGKLLGSGGTGAEDADKDEAWDTAVRRSQFPAKSF